VSVVIPVRNAADRAGKVVSGWADYLPRLGREYEILVVDDGSTDGTARGATAAGAAVVRAREVLPDLGPGAGKGEALWKALYASKGDILVFCDADVREFDPRFVTGLLGPLLLHDHVGFVKGRYERPGDGGRVTELVARPLISLWFPHLAGFDQPLAGEFAARREVLERLPFPTGYGVDLAVLVDAVADIGLDRAAQVDLGRRVHRNRPLAELRPQAQAVMEAALRRAGVDVGAAVSATVSAAERPPMWTVRTYQRRR
jgi:glucosyl-3-phosphoglycerate synthase